MSLSVGIGAPAATADPAPPVPTSAQDAQAAKEAAEQEIARLQARIVAASERITKQTAAARRAEDEYKAQLPVLDRARAAAKAAKEALIAARLDYEHARDVLAKMMVSNYMSGGGIDALGEASVVTLLTATDPNKLLDAAAYRELASDYQTNVTQQMIDAVEAKKAAEQRQKATLAAVAAQTAKLRAIHKRAADALAKSREAMAALRADMTKAKLSHAEAVATLSTFLGGWSIADPARAAELNALYAEIAAKVAALPLAANKGKWTPKMGQSAANRAIQWIGTPYAWAGGNAHGPTRGVCSDGAAANDCNVIGFDCSGLVLYAWAPYAQYAHFAATQYVQAGSLHPAVSELLPGDLVFWSDSGAGAIHHVAMYVGDGNVVQAPQSGDIVRITPLENVASGYFGATRPMT